MPDPPAHPSDATIARFLSGRLGLGEEAGLLAHLDACATCHALVAGLLEVEARERAGLLPPVPASYTRAVRTFAAGFAPKIHARGDLGAALGGAIGTLLAFLAPPEGGGAPGAGMAFASRAPGGPDPDVTRAIGDAIEHAPPLGYRLHAHTLTLTFPDVESLGHFTFRLPAELVHQAVVEGRRLVFTIPPDGGPGEIADGPVRYDPPGASDPDERDASPPDADAPDSDLEDLAAVTHPTPLSPAPIERADPIIGLGPENGRSSAVHQHYADTCAIRCQQLVLQQYGVVLSEEELMAEAQRYGWYGEGHGTSVRFVGNLLEAHGVSTARYVHANVFNLTAELARGHKVIIGVDSGDLWHANAAREQLAHHLGLHSADHAVIVSGIDTTDPGDVKVVITDPGTGDVARAYPLGDFLAAWKDSGFFMVATQTPAPLAFNPEMAHFDYDLGHVHSLGGLSYDEFERAFGPGLHVAGSSILRDQADAMIRSIEADDPADHPAPGHADLYLPASPVEFDTHGHHPADHPHHGSRHDPHSHPHHHHHHDPDHHHDLDPNQHDHHDEDWGEDHHDPGPDTDGHDPPDGDDLA